VILATLVFQISCGSINTQTDKRRWKVKPVTAVCEVNNVLVHAKTAVYPPWVMDKRSLYEGLKTPTERNVSLVTFRQSQGANYKAFAKQHGVALTGRNTTGPPRAAPGELRYICECYRRRQTTATVTSLAPYTMCRRADNNCWRRLVWQFGYRLHEFIVNECDTTGKFISSMVHTPPPLANVEYFWRQKLT